MMPLRTRADLLGLIAGSSAITAACARAIDRGRAYILGGFTPPEEFPRYMVRVYGQHGSEWIVAVEIDEERRKHVVRVVEDVPWAHWDGSAYGCRLIDGDTPKAATEFRRRARHETPASETDEAE